MTGALLLLDELAVSPPKLKRVFSVWMGASIPPHYTSIAEICSAVLALVPSGSWDEIELLMKAGEGGSWIAENPHPGWGDPHPLAIQGPQTLASHRAAAKPLGVTVSPYVVVRARSAWIAGEQAMIRQCVSVAGRCVLNVEPGTAYYNGPADPGFIRGYLAGIGVRASALEVCLIPRAQQVAELGGVECLQAWTDPTLVGGASWEMYGISSPGEGVTSLQVDAAMPRLDGWGIPQDLSFRTPVVQHDERLVWAGTIWCAQSEAVWWLGGN